MVCCLGQFAGAHFTDQNNGLLLLLKPVSLRARSLRYIHATNSASCRAVASIFFIYFLVASRSILGCPQLVHLGHAHLKLFILALLVRVTFVLQDISQLKPRVVRSGHWYLALPRQVVLLMPAAVQGNQKVCA